MSKRMPFAGYGADAAAPSGPGAGLSKRARGMSPLTSSGGAPKGGASAPRVPPPSPLPPDIDLTALMDDRVAETDVLTKPAGGKGGIGPDDVLPGVPMDGAAGQPGGLSAVLQMILRGQGGRA